MEVILVHPMLQIADPNRLVLAGGSLVWLLVLRAVKLMRRRVLTVWNIVGRRRRHVMLRRHHRMLHYHRRRRILHRHPPLRRWLLRGLFVRLLILLCLMRRLLLWLRIRAVRWHLLRLFLYRSKLKGQTKLQIQIGRKNKKRNE